MPPLHQIVVSFLGIHLNCFLKHTQFSTQSKDFFLIFACSQPLIHPYFVFIFQTGRGEKVSFFLKCLLNTLRGRCLHHVPGPCNALPPDSSHPVVPMVGNQLSVSEESSGHPECCIFALEVCLAFS